MLAAGCATTPGGVPQDATPLPPCQATVAEQDGAEWLEVQAEGFTFCVPAAWRPVGSYRNGVAPRTWRGEGGKIEWGRGIRPRKVAGTTVAVADMPGALPALPGEIRRFSEVISGSEALLWNNRFEHRHFTGVEWMAPDVYLQGEAPSARLAERQLAVYRSVRFQVGND